MGGLAKACRWVLCEKAQGQRSAATFPVAALNILFGMAASTVRPQFGLKPTGENQYDENDQDNTNNTDAAVTVTVSVAAEAAAEATKQENDQDDEKYDSKR
jgi:hypothetical protein